MSSTLQSQATNALPFRFLDLPPELRIMVYEHILHVNPILNICKQIRNESTQVILPKLRIYADLQFGESWTVHICPERLDLQNDDDFYSMLTWENFRTSYVATTLDMFHRVSIREQYTSRPTIYGHPASWLSLYLVKYRDCGASGDLSSFWSRTELATGSDGRLQIRRSVDPVLYDLANRFCGKLNDAQDDSDELNDGRAYSWLEKVHDLLDVLFLLRMYRRREYHNITSSSDGCLGVCCQGVKRSSFRTHDDRWDSEQNWPLGVFVYKPNLLKGSK